MDSAVDQHKMAVRHGDIDARLLDRLAVDGMSDRQLGAAGKNVGEVAGRVGGHVGGDEYARRKIGREIGDDLLQRGTAASGATDGDDVFLGHRKLIS